MVEFHTKERRILRTQRIGVIALSNCLQRKFHTNKQRRQSEQRIGVIALSNYLIIKSSYLQMLLWPAAS